LQKSSPRLGPRSDDVEEQATERQADCEWVWQLFTSFRSSQITSVSERMRQPAAAGIGPVDKILRGVVVHAVVLELASAH
jgi:hypothetical protein